MRKKLFANWGIKLISLLVAFALWFAVVYLEDPPGEETFLNIPVTFENTEKLTEQGQVYEVLDNTDVVTRVTVKGPKTVLANIRSDSIIATADFNEKTMTDVVPIRFEIDSQYASLITDITPSEGSEQLKLFVEDKISKSVPIKTNIVGEVASDHQLGTYRTEQTRLTVTGGQSKVEQVSYAAVTVDVTGNETDIFSIETIRLYGKEDNLLDGSLVQKNISTTKVTITVLNTKTVPVEISVMGTPHEDYRMTGQIEQSVESVKIAGTEAVLNSINSIVIPAEVLDVTGSMGDFVKEIGLRSYLPSGAQIARDEENTSVKVTVSIEAIKEVVYKVFSHNVSVINVPEGLSGQVDAEYVVYDMPARGLKAELDTIRETTLRGTIDVAAWMAENGMSQLEPGGYYIPADMDLPEHVEQQRVEIRVIFNSVENSTEE